MGRAEADYEDLLGGSSESVRFDDGSDPDMLPDAPTAEESWLQAEMLRHLLNANCPPTCREEERDLILYWVEVCRKLAAKRLPDGVISRVWPDLWRFMPAGDQLYVIRAPREAKSQSDLIYIPEASQPIQHYGHVLTVGPNIFDQPGHARWFTNPLDLVGREIYWAIHAGLPLARHPLDRSYDSQILMISVTEVMGMRVMNPTQENP